VELQAVYDFVRVAHANTWASGKNKIPQSLLTPREEGYFYADDLWEYIDRYRGGASFIGHEIVRYDGRDVWSMNYSGRILFPETDVSAVYLLLKEALLTLAPGELPLRGPTVYTLGHLEYMCETDEEEEGFVIGEECILDFEFDNIVYKGNFHTVLVRP
jgi:hypothetical protein